MFAFPESTRVAFLLGDGMCHLASLFPYVGKPLWAFLNSQLPCLAYHGALTDSETPCQLFVERCGEVPPQVVQHLRVPEDACRIVLMLNDAPHLRIVIYALSGRLVCHSLIDVLKRHGLCGRTEVLENPQEVRCRAVVSEKRGAHSTKA